MQSRYKTHKSH